MTGKILVGDVRQRVKEIADNSIHCVVTSVVVINELNSHCLGIN